VMKWFARGRLWTSPAEAQAAQRAPKVPPEKRGHGWRPGGEHRDPRERFKKRAQSHSPTHGPWRDRDKPAGPRESRPWAAPKAGPPRGNRPRAGNPPAGRPRGASSKPAWSDPARAQKPFPARKPFAPRGASAQRKPWQRDRPPDRREETPPKRTPETPATPSGPPPSEQIRTTPKRPEKG
jgi:hypothetical protein